MADNTPSLLGQNLLTGSDTLNYLKVFSGRVLGIYDAMLKTRQWENAVNVGAGESHKFDYYGNATAQHHVRGEDTGDPANGYTDLFELTEKRVYVDRPVVSASTLDEWDEDIAHWAAAPKFAERHGRALAELRETYVLRTAILGARADEILTGQGAGASGATIAANTVASFEVGTFNTSGTAALAAIQLIAQTFDEKNVPSDGRVIFVRPQAYYNLITAGSSDLVLINQELGAGGNGSVVHGKVAMAYGITICKSNMIPSVDVGSNPTGARNTYSGTFGLTEAIAWQRDGLATVERRGVTSKLVDMPRHLGKELLSYYTTGHSFLRPECFVEVTNAAA